LTGRFFNGNVFWLLAVTSTILCSVKKVYSSINQARLKLLTQKWEDKTKKDLSYVLNINIRDDYQRGDKKAVALNIPPNEKTPY
jgi:hypothetical protein